MSELIEDARTQIISACKSVFDPELPVNIYDLGLIYDIEIDEKGEQVDVGVTMTLTSPSCPVAGSLPGDVETAIQRLDIVRCCDVRLTWSPMWTMDKMSDVASLELGFM